MITEGEIERAFRFLVDAHGFEAEHSSHSRSTGIRVINAFFRSPSLVVRTTFNPIDSINTELLPLASEEQRFSVGTLLAALDQVRTTRFANPSKALVYHAQFLKLNIELLLNLPEEMVTDCLALRFWHSANQRSAWGTSHQLSPEEIQGEHERLQRLQARFIKPAISGLP